MLTETLQWSNVRGVIVKEAVLISSPAKAEKINPAQMEFPAQTCAKRKPEQHTQPCPTQRQEGGSHTVPSARTSVPRR